MYIIFVQNVWICRKINCVELLKFNGKLCTLNVRNVQICKEIEYTELRKLKKKLCTLYLHRMSGFAKKLNIQNSENSTGNSIHYIYIYIYIRNVWICRKIESLELRKFNGKFVYNIYVRNFRIWKKLNIQNW